LAPVSRASALEGERKQVTVLFADVKGSMELAEQLARSCRLTGSLAHRGCVQTPAGMDQG
jgi:hypothetical protein